MIQAIIFDCFGVLTTDTWRAFLATLPPETDTTHARELNKQYDAGLLTEQEFLAQVQESIGHTPQQVENIPHTDIAKNTQLLTYISTLKPQYKIGLLSNIATNWITDSFLTVEEQSLFDTMVFSHDVGMTKPDPRIYQVICEQLGVDTEETVMIDDVQTYVMGAQNLGIQGIVYEDFLQCKQDLERILAHM